MDTPLVSVVIPTRNRPELLDRAVQSVLRQSFDHYEIVVVIDGEDALSKQVVEKYKETGRLRCMMNPVSAGGSEARNIGVRESSGWYIAFLDDDDEFLPQKLARVVGVAQASSYQSPVVYSQACVRSPRRDKSVPSRGLRPGEPISEYLCRRTLSYGPVGGMQTSTLLVPRELMLRTPFTVGLARHQDWDWAIRVAAAHGVGFEFIPEPLSIWYVDDERARIGNKRLDWTFSLNWARSLGALMTPSAYAAYLLTTATLAARRQGDRRGMIKLFCEAVRHGRPSLTDLILHGYLWIVPIRFVGWLRRLGVLPQA